MTIKTWDISKEEIEEERQIDYDISFALVEMLERGRHYSAMSSDDLDPASLEWRIQYVNRDSRIFPNEEFFTVATPNGVYIQWDKKEEAES